MSYVFGIDLGTTYSCIAYIDEYGKPVVLKNRDGEHTTPSVVMAETREQIIVGSEAKRSIETDPDKTVQFIKRKMGREDDTVQLNGVTYHAPEISALILRRLVEDANSELIQTGVIEEGEEIKDVVITCPAYFGMNERQATRTAGELAGLNVLDIINEPTAAAISYGIGGGGRDETVLVYDLGGGTFDITVMTISGSNISVVCTGGDAMLGGKDWDEALIGYISGLYEAEYDESIEEDPETYAALYNEVEVWKKALTSREKVNISVHGSAGRIREELTRARFEDLTSELLERTKNLLDGVLDTARKRGITLKDIDKVLLVGGSSRMPQVSAMIERDYGITPVISDPDEAVAKGAAIYAGSQKQFNDFILDEAARTGKTVDQVKDENAVSGELDKKFALMGGSQGGLRINITNVLSRTYGVEALDDSGKSVIVNMLFANDTLPATKTQNFYTSVSNQNEVDINIYESLSSDYSMDIEDRTPITSIPMKLLRPVPRDTMIVTTLALDNSGLLHIVAEEQKNGTRLDTTFQLSNQMSEEEMRSASVRMSRANVE